MNNKDWKESVEKIEVLLKKTGGKLFVANRESVEDDEYPEDGVTEYRAIEFEEDEETGDIIMYGERLETWGGKEMWAYDEVACKDFPIYEGEYNQGYFETFEDAVNAIEEKIKDEKDFEETVDHEWTHR